MWITILSIIWDNKNTSSNEKKNVGNNLVFFLILHKEVTINIFHANNYNDWITNDFLTFLYYRWHFGNRSAGPAIGKKKNSSFFQRNRLSLTEEDHPLQRGSGVPGQRDPRICWPRPWRPSCPSVRCSAKARCELTSPCGWGASAGGARGATSRRTWTSGRRTSRCRTSAGFVPCGLNDSPEKNSAIKLNFRYNHLAVIIVCYLLYPNMTTDNFLSSRFHKKILSTAFICLL